MCTRPQGDNHEALLTRCPRAASARAWSLDFHALRHLTKSSLGVKCLLNSERLEV